MVALFHKAPTRGTLLVRLSAIFSPELSSSSSGMAARASFLAAELRKRRQRNSCYWGVQLQATILYVLFQAQQQANARPHTTPRAEPVHHTWQASASIPPLDQAGHAHSPGASSQRGLFTSTCAEAFPRGLHETPQYGLLPWHFRKEEGAVGWGLLVSEGIPPPALCDSSVGNVEQWGAGALPFILPLAWMKF